MSRGVVLVTGGAGYVGSHACKALALAGFTPVTFDNFSTGNRWAVRFGPLEPGDILDLATLHSAFKRHRPIAVMHFAGAALVGESMREPAFYWRQNLTGTLNLVEACRIHEVGAFVFSSTCAVYGTPERVPIDEDAPKAPINPYGASKLAAERLLADAAMAYGLRFAALRYFNAAGAQPDGSLRERHDPETHLVPIALEVAAGKRAELTVFGRDYPTPDGTCVRDYVHIEDLARAHVAAIDRADVSGPINLGTGRGSSVREVVKMAEEVSGRPVPHEIGPRRAGDPPVLVASAARAEERLGWRAELDLRRIVQDAHGWLTRPR